MSSTVVPLNTQREQCKQSAVGVLEHALEQARNGEIVSVAVAIVRPNGAASSMHSDTDCLPALIGAANVSLHRLMEDV